MRFKIENNCQLFTDLQTLLKRAREYDTLAREWLKENAPDSGKQYLKPFSVVGGGVEGVQFTEKPKGWKKASRSGFYKPGVRSAVRKSFDALPTVRYGELNKLLNLKDYVPWMSPGYGRSDKLILIDIGTKHVKGYEPIEGMVEITYSEYDRLMDEIYGKES